MNQLLEYALRHYFLVPATLVVAVLAIVLEVRHRTRGGAAISPNEAVGLMNKGGTLVLDVRDTKDYETGHIIDARSIPAADLQGKIDTFKKYREKPVIVYCDNGMAASGAAQRLRTAGFTKVVTLRGGLNAWRQENLPVVKTNQVKRKDGKAA